MGVRSDELPLMALIVNFPLRELLALEGGVRIVGSMFRWNDGNDDLRFGLDLKTK